MDHQQHFSRDPRVCGGGVVVRGTQVILRTVLASLREGASAAEIIGDFPTITEEDVRAVIAFAGEGWAKDGREPASEEDAMNRAPTQIPPTFRVGTKARRHTWTIGHWGGRAFRSARSAWAA